MRQHPVDPPQKRPAQQKTDQRWQGITSAEADGWVEQGPKAGRDHHPRGETEHGVQQPGLDGAEKEDESGANGCHQPGEACAQQGQQNGIRDGQRGHE